MLRTTVHDEPIVATQSPGILSRTPARLLAARTLEELRGVLATVLGGLYHDHTRFDLYVRDRDETLAPVVGPGSRPDAGGQLLATLRARLHSSRRALTEPLLLPALREAQHGAMMSAPLLGTAQELIGIIVVEAAPDEPEFTRLHVVVLEGIAALISLAVQRLRAKGVGRALARLEIDRKAACRVQRGLMSDRLPPDIGVTAHTEYQPAFDVGGDFYSLKHLGDRRVSVAIGDVSGCGVPAALVMSRVAADLERALDAGNSPSRVLQLINDRVSDLESETFVTAACIHLDARTRRLTAANAGHLPLIVRRASGEVFTFCGASGMPLGVEPCDYQDEELTLEPRDIVLLTTDGLLEALDHPSGRMGLSILMDVVRDAPHDARAVSERIRAAVARARQEHVLDDITWVGLQLAA